MAEDRNINIATNQIGFSLHELAGQLRVSVGLLRLEVARGRLHPTRIGRRVLITQAELHRYLTAHTDGDAQGDNACA